LVGKISQDYLEELKKENVSKIVKGAFKSFDGHFDADVLQQCIA